MSSVEADECPICLEKKANAKELPCKHSFCDKCLREMVKHNNTEEWAMRCPLCRQPFDREAVGLDSPAELQPIDFASLVEDFRARMRNG